MQDKVYQLRVRAREATNVPLWLYLCIPCYIDHRPTTIHLMNESTCYQFFMFMRKHRHAELLSLEASQKVTTGFRGLTLVHSSTLLSFTNATFSNRNQQNKIHTA